MHTPKPSSDWRKWELQRLAAEGKAVENEDVEMTLTRCEQLRVLGYVEDCSHLR